MRLDELIDLNKALKANQYLKLIDSLKIKIKPDINSTRIKNQIMQSWKKGNTSRAYYDKMLSKINLKLKDLI